MVKLIKQKPLPGFKKRRRIQKRVVKRIKKVFPIATIPLGNKLPRITNI